VSDQEIGYTISFRAFGGAIGTIQAGSLLDARYPMERLEILGVGGNVVVDEFGFRHHPAPGFSEPAARHIGWLPTPYRAPHRNLAGYEEELRHFVQSVRSESRPSPDIEDSAKTLRLVERLAEMLA
jgi:predicted dehydrogenase